MILWWFLALGCVVAILLAVWPSKDQNNKKETDEKENNKEKKGEKDHVVLVVQGPRPTTPPPTVLLVALSQEEERDLCHPPPVGYHCPEPGGPEPENDRQEKIRRKIKKKRVPVACPAGYFCSEVKPGPR